MQLQIKTEIHKTNASNKLQKRITRKWLSSLMGGRSKNKTETQ